MLDIQAILKRDLKIIIIQKVLNLLEEKFGYWHIKKVINQDSNEMNNSGNSIDNNQVQQNPISIGLTVPWIASADLINTKRGIMRLIIFVILDFIANVSFTAALDFTPASSVLSLEQTTSIYIAFASYLLLKEKFNSYKVLGLIIAIYIHTWIGLSIMILFGIKFMLQLPNNQEL